MSEEPIVLPEGFKSVDYIQSTGTQNITFSLTTAPGDKVVLETECKFDATNNQAEGLIGTAAFYFGISGGKWYCAAGSAGVSTITADVKWHKIKLIHSKEDSGLYIDDVKILSQTFNSTAKLIPSIISIFNINGSYYCKNSKRSWKLSINDELVHDLMPCLDADGVPCMYDIITEQSFYNKGTGNFLYAYVPHEDINYGIIDELPEGFTKLEYLLANGDSVIDTGYIPTNETGYYVEGQVYEATDNGSYFGSIEKLNYTDYKRIYCYGSANILWGWGGSGTLTNNANYLRQETVINFNFLNSRKVIATINATDVSYNLPDLDFTPKQSIYIFASNCDYQDTSTFLRGLIRVFKISEGTEIVRHFVPCLDTDGIPCMYELKTGVAYYNKGKIGNFVTPRNYPNSIVNLPPNYKKCTYLQSNGNQYIDTGFVPNAETGLYYKVQHIGTGNMLPFGVNGSNGSCYPPRYNSANTYLTYYWGNNSVGNNNLMFKPNVGDDYLFSASVNLYNDDTVNVWSEDTEWHGGIRHDMVSVYTSSLYLFSFNNGSGAMDTTYGKFVGRIFRAKITQGQELVHDYIPCLDDNNKPCMFDLITQETLYNQGTGEDFDYCIENQLPSNFTKLEFLENTDKQYIKTGYVPTNNTGMYLEGYNTVVADTAAMGMQNTTGNDRVWIGGVMSATYGARYGWGAITTPNGTGDTRFVQSLNWLNNKKSIITCPLFAEKINTLSNLTFTPNKDIAIFGYNQNGKVISWKGRVYRAKISEGDTIVRDFIPAWDDLKQRPCLYDLVENKPYYNDGEGEFGINDDREGTYTGFTFFGCIGNRLGGLYQ